MTELTPKEKSLLAFILFAGAMRLGPDLFDAIEDIATKCGVLPEYTLKATDFKHYSETTARAREQGKQLVRGASGSNTDA